MTPKAPAEPGSHQLVTEFDPDRPNWCYAACTCGGWMFESITEPDPDSHLLVTSRRAELEWRKHLPAIPRA